MNELEKQEFIQLMAAVMNVKTPEELEQGLQALGESGLHIMADTYQKVKGQGELGLKLMQETYNQLKLKNSSVYAKLGAKLNYINSLRGKCPEGYEVESYKIGGCVKCKKTSKPKMEKGGPAKLRFKETTIANDPDFVHKKRTWSDGTTSEMIADEAGTVYKGRKGEVGITNVPNEKLNAVADSLRKADWKTPLKKKRFNK